MVANLKKMLLTFSAPNDLPNHLRKYCTRALNHPDMSLNFCCKLFTATRLNINHSGLPNSSNLSLNLGFIKVIGLNTDYSNLPTNGYNICINRSLKNMQLLIKFFQSQVETDNIVTKQVRFTSRLLISNAAKPLQLGILDTINVSTNCGLKC
jgi:hypothetical protein